MLNKKCDGFYLIRLALFTIGVYILFFSEIQYYFYVLFEKMAEMINVVFDGKSYGFSKTYAEVSKIFEKPFWLLGINCNFLSCWSYGLAIFFKFLLGMMFCLYSLGCSLFNKKGESMNMGETKEKLHDKIIDIDVIMVIPFIIFGTSLSVVGLMYIGSSFSTHTNETKEKLHDTIIQQLDNVPEKDMPIVKNLIVQAIEMDRFWKAVGMHDENITIDDAIRIVTEWKNAYDKGNK